MIFPWIEEAKNTLSLRDPECERRTAIAFLDMMQQLRVVVLQDAAILMEDESRSKHQLFLEFDVFSSPLFHEFRAQMRATLTQAVDPTNTALSTVLPGVHERLEAINHNLSAQTHVLSRQVQSLRRDVHHIDKRFDGVYDRFEQTDANLALFSTRVQNALQNALTAFTNTAPSQDNLYIRNTCHEMLGDVTPACHAFPQAQTDALPPPHPPRVTIAPRPPPLAVLNNTRTDRLVFTIPSSWKSFEEILNFWNGKGEYKDLPMPGGVAAMEQLHKNRWRKHFTQAQKKAFSRLKIVCVASLNLLQDQSVTMHELEETFSGPCRKNLCNCELVFKRNGWHKTVRRPNITDKPLTMTRTDGDT
jgi:hypothetical protein